MIEVVKLEKWMEEELEDKYFIECLLDQLEQQQLASLLIAAEIEIPGKDIKKLHKEFIRKKLLISTVRRKLIYKKITPPMTFVEEINFNEISKKEIIEIAKKNNYDNRAIALILFLQNYYEDALAYYFFYLQDEKQLENLSVSKERKLRLENNALKIDNEEIKNELIKQHIEFERLGSKMGADIQRKQEIIKKYMKQNGSLKQELKDRQPQKNTKDTIEEKNSKQIPLNNNSEKIKRSKVINTGVPTQKDFQIEEHQSSIEKVVENFPGHAIDIAESLELTKDTLDETINAINQKLSQLVIERSFENSEFLFQLAETVHYYEKVLNQFIEVLDVEDLDQGLSDENLVEKDIPNYEAYLVDNEIEYTLYEDFTHKRPHAFKINNDYKIEAKTWKEILVKTCELLVAVDNEKFNAFEHNPKMNGRRSKYFTSDQSKLWNPANVHGIYVETKISANGIRNLIIKMLQEYQFKVSEFKIYLRADYTDLHKLES